MGYNGRLTKSAHFIPIKITYPLQKLVETYICEILRLHGILSSIILDKIYIDILENFVRGIGNQT